MSSTNSVCLFKNGANVSKVAWLIPGESWLYYDINPHVPRATFLAWMNTYAIDNAAKLGSVVVFGVEDLQT